MNSTFTEFYVQTTGSNLNAGSTSTNAATFTYASGSWVASTGVFTVASGNPLTDLTPGETYYASVYADGSALTGFVGRMTTWDATTITVSLTAKSGTAPTDGTNTRTLKIGGAWKGSNAAEAFPYGFLQSTYTNVAANPARVNWKGGTDYNVTATMTHANNGPIVWECYTTLPGDLGRASIDGGVAGAGYTILTLSGTNNILKGFVFKNNGASGSTGHGLAITGAGSIAIGCVAHDLRLNGFNISTGGGLIKCEAYACNQSGTSNSGGVVFPSGTTSAFAIRCISHDNIGTTSQGFYSDGVVFLENCIADSNGGRGFYFNSSATIRMVGCDSYNNGFSGLETFGASKVYVQNSNIIKNGLWDILATSGTGLILTEHVRFGAGTQASISGSVSSYVGIVQIDSQSYAADVTPWPDPANGDFRINLSAAKGAGEGAFTQTAASYAGTTSYPDIGAGQHQDSGGGGGVFPFFRQRYRAR